MSDYLCEELIFEIFTRLPPKSLLRFRSLSKYFCSFIASPSFIRMHSFRPRKKLLIKQIICLKVEPYIGSFYTLHPEDKLPLDCSTRDGYIGITPFKFPPKYESHYIAGSCNGILCLFDFKNGISLWNPSIRRNLTLTLTLTTHLGSYKFSLGIGFGFDRMTEDYKVVVLSYNPHHDIKYEPDGAFVYTMKTGTWCRITCPNNSVMFNVAASRACLLNGALHWVVECYFSHQSYILTFDLSSHVFGKIALPPPLGLFKKLVIVQGSLALVYSRSFCDIRIWVLKEYNNTASWTSMVFISKTGQTSSSHGGGLFLDTFCHGNDLFNAETGTRSSFKMFNADSGPVDKARFDETLQLLDMEEKLEPVDVDGWRFSFASMAAFLPDY